MPPPMPRGGGYPPTARPAGGCSDLLPRLCSSTLLRFSRLCANRLETIRCHHGLTCSRPLQTEFIRPPLCLSLQCCRPRSQGCLDPCNHLMQQLLTMVTPKPQHCP